MTAFIFPSAVAICVFGSWIALGSFEACTSQNTDPKFDCWTSLQLIAVFACIGSVLTGLMAFLARLVLSPFFPFDTSMPELMSALLSSIVLVLLFSTVIPWESESGNIGILFFGWLGISFVICGSSLMIVKWAVT